MTKLDRLIAINKLSQKDKKWIHKDIFRILRKDEIWIAAYENLKGTSGSTPETMDRMSLKRLKRLQDSVYSEKYIFKTVKPQANRKTNDKIVQEIMRMILEAIYEPVFSELSFGFRTGLGCHDALYHVERKFRWVDHIVEGDLVQASPTIDHHILVKLLTKRIEDPRFLRLVWKLLRCGVLDENQEIWSKTGVPLSPILANIYYHELDEYVQEIKERWETPVEDRSLEYQIRKVSSKERQLKTLRTSSKDKITRIEYVRYADDWMVGVAGNKNLAIQIKDELAIFMKNTLAQELHPVKTKVTDLRKGNAHFLGYQIFLPRNRPISEYKGKQLRFDVPVDQLTQRYTERGYFKQLANKVRPISKVSYSVLEDHVIVSHYRKIWLGLLNYYSGCTNRRRLQYIHYLLHMSCAMTLGHRHRTSCSKIFRKHGKTLTVKVPHKDKTVSFPYKTSWKLSERRWLCGKQVMMHVPYVTQRRKGYKGL